MNRRGYGGNMNTKQQSRETVRSIVLVLALAGSMFAFNGWARASETEGSTEAGVSAEQGAPDPGVTGSQQRSWWQQRQERRRARAQEYSERLWSAKQAAPQNKGVPAAMSRPAALADINVSFKLDPRLTRASTWATAGGPPPPIPVSRTGNSPWTPEFRVSMPRASRWTSAPNGYRQIRRW